VTGLVTELAITELQVVASWLPAVVLPVCELWELPLFCASRLFSFGSLWQATPQAAGASWPFGCLPFSRR